MHAPRATIRLFVAALLGFSCAAYGQRLEIGHQYPCNLFETGTPVTFGVSAKGGKGVKTVNWRVTDYDGNVVASGETPISEKIAVTGLPRGWYQLDATGGEKGADTTTFGVTDFFSRTAEEAAARGIRFGMRHRSNLYEGLDACIKLGMQWERNLYINAGAVAKSSNPDEWEWDAALARYREHVIDREVLLVKKVELFPEHCYDAERYGPMEDYRDPIGKHPWSKRTVPMKEPYKQWVAQLVRRLPAEQKLFEVWNEPWGKYPPEDFAQILIWTVEAIKEVRPDALVGPDSGNIGYDIKLAEHGGFANCDLVTIHPYVSHPERTGIRSKIRLYHKFMREHLGKELSLYTTEWGFASSKDPHKQAAYMVRQAMAMYAEDIKTLIPYIMTPSRAQARSGASHYGYVNYDFEPYPAFIAYANCARMIDGSTFLGDLWMGEYVGAMLFERDGELTAALWTDGEPRTVRFNAEASEVTHVNIMGVETSLATNGKPLELTLTDDPVYLVGVGAARRAQAKPLDDPRRRWPHERDEVVRTAPMTDTPPTIDGRVDDKEWQGALTLQLDSGAIPADDASGTAKLLWDEQCLYIAVQITDDDPMYNPHADMGVYKGDSIELYVSAKPEMRIPETRGQYDYQVIIAPTSGTGEPLNFFPGHGAVATRRLEGETLAFSKSDHAWLAEMALPFANFPGLEAKGGTVAAFEIIVNDLDKNNPVGGRNKVKPVDSLGSKWHRDAALWGTLIFGEGDKE